MTKVSSLSTKYNRLGCGDALHIDTIHLICEVSAVMVTVTDPSAWDARLVSTLEVVAAAAFHHDHGACHLADAIVVGVALIGAGQGGVIGRQEERRHVLALLW